MSRAVFFVQSPLQLLNAIEAKNQFKFNRNILIIRQNSSGLNNSQIDKVLSYDNTFDKVIKLKVVTRIDYLKVLIIIWQFIDRGNDKVFVGDIRSILSSLPGKFVRYDKFYLLDDGLPTLNIVKTNTKINLYTFLELENNSDKRKIIGNNFTYLRSINGFSKKIIETDKVYFIGAPLIEKGIVSMGLFVEKMNAIIAYYESKGMKVVYLPHRAEKLDKLNQFYFHSIINNSVPIEIMFIQSDRIPAIIASFYSAALYTLNSIFKESLSAQAFYLKTNEIKSKSRLGIQNCYDYFDKKIDVIKDYSESISD